MLWAIIHNNERLELVAGFTPHAQDHLIKDFAADGCLPGRGDSPALVSDLVSSFSSTEGS